MKGTCRYCGQMRIVNADIDSTEEELNELAVDDCDCEGAKIFRKRRNDADIAKATIDSLFGETHPCTAAVLKECIPLVQDGRIKEINIKVTSRVKAQLKKSKTDSTLVNKTVTTKEELDTE